MKTIKIKTKSNSVSEIEKLVGLNLSAKTANDTVNGYVNFVKIGEYYEATIVLYDKDRSATFEKYKKDGIDYAKGSKTSFKKAELSEEKLKKVGDII